MDNEDLVNEYFGNALALGRQFAKGHDPDEWASFAAFELWRAALLFKHPEGRDRFRSFWGFARRHIEARMIDRLRQDTNRGKRRFIGLPACLTAADCYSSIDAKLSVERAIRRAHLSKTEKKVALADLAGVSLHFDTHAHRYQAIRKMRAACA